MSELKARHAFDVYEEYTKTGDDEHFQVYIKAEADKVIAELKKEKEYVIEHTAEVINAQERELRHQKYKRCLAMAKLCHWKMGVFIYKKEKNDFYHRWHKHWFEIAEKFKDIELEIDK